MQENAPRLPTAQELEELAQYQVTRYANLDTPVDFKKIRQDIEEAYIAVFDEYVSPRLDYAGKVMYVIGYSPSESAVYIWRHGRLQLEELVEP